ncbi:MAG: glucose-6-phosphate dehydrogenase assembly protein OpcA [Micrococcales bacterium]|nr:glucose-6-phosphate dehydrogenase assembly protein OpcA [Micrococcales bacterium]
MIIPLHATSVSQVATKLAELRAQAGSAALARGLSLVVECEPADIENTIQTAIASTMEHPTRVVLVTSEAPDAPASMDAQIRVGSDGGSGEVIVLRVLGEATRHLAAVVAPLLVPDVPVAAWWPAARPDHPAQSPLGQLASRRITDAREAQDQPAALKRLSSHYTSGDSDLCWARLSPWRALLVTALTGVTAAEQISSAVVTGPAGVAVDLMAAWIASTERVPVRWVQGPSGPLGAVELNYSGGGRLLLDKARSGAGVVLHHTGQPDQQLVLSRQSTPDSLAEELRRLGPDPVYGELVTKALPVYWRNHYQAKPPNA